jgi:hypothetical protein
MKKLFYCRSRASKGAALMIVLAFVVLLTGLALVYFSRATTDRQLAQSSYSDTSADLLARSAFDIVVSDLKQELLDPNSATVTAANIQPQRSGNDASIPNLIRRSVRSDPIPVPPGVPSLASAVSSGPVDPANPRRGEITLSRWNKHYLIPRHDTGTTIDSNPISPLLGDPAGFIPPDWVLVTRNGPVAFSGWQNSLKDPTSTNTNYVVARYAFTVYDEGGLLDMNVAGYPNWSGNPGGSCNPAPTPWLTNVGRKGTVGFADLTGLGTYAPLPTQVDNIVGWRNYATTLRPSTQPFGNFIFPGDNCMTQDSYGSYLLDFGDPPFAFDDIDQPVPISSYPFSAVYPTTSNSRTDQALMARQELLRLLRSIDPGWQNYARYLGTFSRERNQPAADWPHLGNNLRDGRFCFDNLDLVKPNPDNSCSHGRGKGRSKSKGRGHLCGTQEDIVDLFGLLWVKSSDLPPLPNGDPQPGRWRYINHAGKSWDHTNQNPHGHINCWRGPKKQNDFFQILHFALNRLACASGYQPGNLARTFAIGASLIDQFDSDSDDVDLTVQDKYQTHTTVIEFAPGVLAYGMEPTSNGNANSAGDCAAGDASGNCRNHPHRPSGAPVPGPNTKVTNHALSSVGEFGYAIDTSSPGLPSLNLSASGSDTAVLDFFGYNPISSSYPRAGILNLNTKNVPVLATIIKGAAPTDGSTSYVDQTAATAAAQAIVAETTARPALTRADVARLASVVTNSPFTTNEETRETIARALAEVGQTRTWNLLIDVIAQTGHYAPNAQNLTDFVPEGEKRYWLHIALGRDLNDDGSVDVLGTQLEEVIE